MNESQHYLDYCNPDPTSKTFLVSEMFNQSKGICHTCSSRQKFSPCLTVGESLLMSLFIFLLDSIRLTE